MADLAQVLRQLPAQDDPDLLAGDNPADDAAVYRLTPDVAVVQSVDFFTPVVDDPYEFGRIAAANSLSDIYAVGGTPRIALNIAAFPVKTLPLEILGDILRGGADVAREAGVTIIGGHTIDDDEPKYGLAVTGTVDPARMITPRGAGPGDVLVLTKPIGTGTISTAIKSGLARAEDVWHAARWMETLNSAASDAMRKVAVTAATDVTGFGLLGHLTDMCRASGVSATVYADRVPFLPFALEYIRSGSVPGGTVTNLEAVEPAARWRDVPEDMRLLLADPQTSGGLLISVPPDRVASFKALAPAAVLTAEIGRIEDGPPGLVEVAVQ
jgi:selenide,water dikinase